MDMERRYAPVPDELVDYLRAGRPVAADDGGVHLHVHHHYAPTGPPAGPAPGRSLAERVIPWLWVALLACVVLTLCAAVLAAVMVTVVVVLVALALFGLVIAYVIRAQAEAVETRARTAGSSEER